MEEETPLKAEAGAEVQTIEAPGDAPKEASIQEADQGAAEVHPTGLDKPAG